MPALEKSDVAASPHGADGSHNAIFSAGLAKSARPVTAAGLPSGTTMTSELCVNTVGVPTTEAASVIIFALAEA